MEKVKIQYIVNGKEFTSEKEAKKYANKLTMNPKYNEGDLVYIKDANGLHKIQSKKDTTLQGCI